MMAQQFFHNNVSRYLSAATLSGFGNSPLDRRSLTSRAPNRFTASDDRVDQDRVSPVVFRLMVGADGVLDLASLLFNGSFDLHRPVAEQASGKALESASGLSGGPFDAILVHAQ
jgi:hypothetical protein